MPDTATLGTVPNVELARTGSWAISTGTWNPKREDFLAAVAALECPAVRAPIVKPGHIDPRFDGQPAIGRVSNLRVADGGHSLVGDLTGLPSWLPQIIAAAYPDRSVEGEYGSRCQLGHHHPFVLTALSLLGVTPPGVGTLRSIQDVGELYGVAAAPAPTAAGDRTVYAVFAAGGPPKTTDENQLKHYWTATPEGLAKWRDHPHPWTALYNHLKKHVDPERAKRIASQWFFEVFGYWPGSRKGKNPVGPG